MADTHPAFSEAMASASGDERQGYHEGWVPEYLCRMEDDAQVKALAQARSAARSEDARLVLRTLGVVLLIVLFCTAILTFVPPLMGVEK